MKRALSLCLPLAAIMLVAFSGCGGGGYTPTVYTAGFYHDGAKYIPCYWEGATRHDLPGDGVHDAQAYGICLAGGVVYTAGYYTGSREGGGTKTIPCYWEGTTRRDLEEGPAPYSSTARAIFVDGGGTVYTAGYYRDGDQTKPCYWTGTERHDLSGSSEGRAYSIFVDGGTVYTAGHYGEESKPCFYVGSTYLYSLPYVDAGNEGSAYSIVVSNDTVYVSGYTADATAGTSTPCYWAGPLAGTRTRYDLPGNGLGEGDAACAYAILVDGGTVYTAGTYYDDTINRTIPCYWAGMERHNISSNSGERYAAANSISLAGGTVFTAGYYYDGAKTNACYWRGTARHDLPGDGTHRSCAESIFVQ